MRLDLLSLVNRERAARRVVVLVTDLESHAQRVVAEHELDTDELARAIADMRRQNRSGVVTWDNRAYFLEIVAPPPRLVIVGATRIAQSLVEMAQLTGYDAIVVDPRGAFATLERFPGAPLDVDWPQTAFARLGVDAHTAVVCLSHNAKIDDEALSYALRADCRYIGALGSRKSHERRRERLAKLGFDAAQLDRIHGPIGIDIGALSTAEIAVSIIAELVLASRRKPLRSEISDA